MKQADASEAPKFRRIDTGFSVKPVSFIFEGKQLQALPGDNVAAALIANGEIIFRASTVTGTARGPFCMMGVCFECLVTIDGVANRQACLVDLTEGMIVERQVSRLDLAR